jgi:hypothetical protein
MADDGRTRVRVWSESQTTPVQCRTIREGTVAPERVAEISTLLAKMVRTGELRPKPWFAPFGDPCDGVKDCQTMYLTVLYQGKVYTELDRWGQLFQSLEAAGMRIGYGLWWSKSHYGLILAIAKTGLRPVLARKSFAAVLRAQGALLTLAHGAPFLPVRRRGA